MQGGERDNVICLRVTRLTICTQGCCLTEPPKETAAFSARSYHWNGQCCGPQMQAAQACPHAGLQGHAVLRQVNRSCFTRLVLLHGRVDKAHLVHVIGGGGLQQQGCCQPKHQAQHAAGNKEVHKVQYDQNEGGCCDIRHHTQLLQWQQGDRLPSGEVSCLSVAGGDNRQRGEVPHLADKDSPHIELIRQAECKNLRPPASCLARSLWLASPGTRCLCCGKHCANTAESRLAQAHDLLTPTGSQHGGSSANCGRNSSCCCVRAALDNPDRSHMHSARAHR